jgi:hypothetical protein
MKLNRLKRTAIYTMIGEHSMFWYLETVKTSPRPRVDGFWSQKGPGIFGLGLSDLRKVHGIRWTWR